MLVKSLELPSNFLNALTLHGSHWVGRGHLSSESLSENQAFYAWKEGKNCLNFALTPTQKAGACRLLVEISAQPVPDHQRCAPSLSLLNLRFLCCLNITGRRSAQLLKKGSASILKQPIALVVGACGPTRLQPATSRPPTGCRYEKEPCGSFCFYHPWSSRILYFFKTPIQYTTFFRSGGLNLSRPASSSRHPGWRRFPHRLDQDGLYRLLFLCHSGKKMLVV